MIRLWRQKDKIYGLFSNYVGPESDPPTDLINKVQFDSRSGALSFEVEVQTGIYYGRGYQGVPAKEVFRFHGKLYRTKIVGALSISDSLSPGKAPQVRRLILSRDLDFTELMDSFQTYDQWKNQAEKYVRKVSE